MAVPRVLDHDNGKNHFDSCKLQRLASTVLQIESSSYKNASR